MSSHSAISTTFPVTGMTCSACVGHVEQALQGLPGVSNIRVNLATERASLDMAGGSTAMVEIVEALEGVGYGVDTNEMVFDIGDQLLHLSLGRINMSTLISSREEGRAPVGRPTYRCAIWA